MEFSGGNGSPLTITLLQPVSYTITTGSSQTAFVFEAAVAGGDANYYAPLSGTITYTVNGGTPRILTHVNSGGSGDDLSADDLFIFGAVVPLSAGDVVTLSAGSPERRQAAWVSTSTGLVATSRIPSGL